MLVMDRQRDHRLVKAWVGHSRHGEQERSGEIGRLFNHDKDNVRVGERWQAPTTGPDQWP
jgi:hypothetical protein